MKKTITVIFTFGLLLIAPLAHADELEKVVQSIKIPDAQAGLCGGWNDKYNEKCGGVKPGEIVSKESAESSQSTKTTTTPQQTIKSEDEGKVLGASTSEPSAYSLLKKEIDALRARLTASEKPEPFDWTPYWLLALILATAAQNEWRLRRVFKRVGALQGGKKRKVIKKS